MDNRWSRSARKLLGRHVPRQRRTPPTCPEGWLMGPPDFVGLGVQRAGTTWWFDEITRHRDVHLAPGAAKEVHFFDRMSDADVGADDIERYHRWFPRPPGGSTGEWTPAYLYDPWSIPMVLAAAPNANFLVMLRDPMDRFQSALGFLQRRGFTHSAAVRDAFHRGLYAHQLEAAMRHIERDRLLVLTYERALADPTTARTRTAEFLGLDPAGYAAPVQVRAPTARARGRLPLPRGLEQQLRDLYRTDIERLVGSVPDLDVTLWDSAD